MKRLVPAVLACAALLCTTAALPAQSGAWTQARRSLQQGPGATFEHNGYRLTREPITGALANADSVELALDLRDGVEYKLVGACDAGCSDLNLTLYDASGAQVDLDDVPDDNCPIVTVAPARAGQYRLRVVMAGCSAGTCRFGVGAYGK